MRIRSTPLLFAALLPALLIQGCNDDPATPDGGGGIGLPTGPVSAVVGAAGGTVSATTDEGVVVTIAIPANAVAIDTELTVRPVAPADDAWFGVRLEPADLQLASPFVVSVTLPESIELDDARLLLGGMAVPTHVDATTRTLSTDALWFFDLAASAPDGTANSPDAAPVDAAPANPAPALLASSSNGGNQLGGASVSCATLAAGAQQRIDAFIATGDLQSAIEAFLALGAVLQGSGCDPSSAIAGAAAKLCDASGTALSALRDQAIASYGDFEDQAKRVLAWGVLLQLLPADCGPDSNYDAVLDAKLEAFLAFYQERLGRLQGVDHGTFQDLKEEAVSVMVTQRTATLLAVRGAAERIYADAFVPTLDRMRHVAYTLCRTKGWHYPLTRITATGFFAARDIIGYPSPRPGAHPGANPYTEFTDDDVFRDLQYCGTALEIASYLPSGDTLATVEAGGGEQPGEESTDVSLQVYTRGSITIDGKLRGFTCWGDTAADRRIDIELNANRVRTLERPGTDAYLPGETIELDVRETTERLGITPREGLPTQLTLTRHRDHCRAELWGPPRIDLVTVDVDWRNPELEVEIELPDTIAPDETAELNVRVAVVDPHGEMEYYDDIDVEFDVTGGTVGSPSGRTDDDGWFRTTVVPEADAPHVQVVAKASAWEGVTEQEQDVAVVRGEPFLVTPVYQHRGTWTSRAYVYTGGSSIDASEAELFVGYDLATGTPGATEARLSARYSYDVETGSLDSVTMHSYTTRAWGLSTFRLLFHVNEPARVRVTGECTLKGQPSDAFWVVLDGQPSGDVERYINTRREARFPECRDVDSNSGIIGPGLYRIAISQSGTVDAFLAEYELTIAFEPAPEE